MNAQHLKPPAPAIANVLVVLAVGLVEVVAGPEMSTKLLTALLKRLENRPVEEFQILAHIALKRLDQNDLIQAKRTILALIERAERYGLEMLAAESEPAFHALLLGIESLGKHGAGLDSEGWPPEVVDVLSTVAVICGLEQLEMPKAVEDVDHQVIFSIGRRARERWEDSSQ